MEDSFRDLLYQLYLRSQRTFQRITWAGGSLFESNHSTRSLGYSRKVGLRLVLSQRTDRSSLVCQIFSSRAIFGQRCKSLSRTFSMCGVVQRDLRPWCRYTMWMNNDALLWNKCWSWSPCGTCPRRDWGRICMRILRNETPNAIFSLNSIGIVGLPYHPKFCRGYRTFPVWPACHLMNGRSFSSSSTLWIGLTIGIDTFLSVPMVSFSRLNPFFDRST